MDDNYNGIQIHDFWDGERMEGEKEREPYTDEELFKYCRLTGMPRPYLTYEELIEGIERKDEENRKGRLSKIKRIGGKSNGKIHK